MPAQPHLPAALLRSSHPLQLFGWMLSATAALGALVAAVNHQGCAALLFATALSAGLLLAWQCLRIQFDIAAFDQIARQIAAHSDNDNDSSQALQDFDTALRQLGLRQGSDGRDLLQRAAATRKLVVRLAMIVCGQLLLVLAGMGALYVA
jgi:hypothetical protein